MKFITLRKEILESLPEITESDILLLEGKLIFSDTDKADLVENHLKKRFDGTHNVIRSVPRVWPHWTRQYTSELYLERIA